MPDAAAPIHIVIPTHTDRYLSVVLAALARQSRTPDSISISCDTDDPRIGAVIATWAPRLQTRTFWIHRPHVGEERLCQVRNNAVRFILERERNTRGRILILDGDMLASDTLVEQHAALGSRADLVLAYRVNVSEEASRVLDAEKVYAGDQRLQVSTEEHRQLAARQRRYQKQLFMNQLRLGPRHKPKLLGGHFSVSLDLYSRLNGFDELYIGWGFKDDEFARRASRMGASIALGVKNIIAWHLFHPTRQPSTPMRELPTAHRFARRDVPVVAERGVRNPLEQPPVVVEPLPSAANPGLGTAATL